GFNAPGGGAGGFRGGNGQGFSTNINLDPETLEAILNQFGGGGLGGIFGGGRTSGGRQRRRARPEPAQASATIPFRTAALGGTVVLSVDGHELNVTIPPGVEEGKKLRLAGQGPDGSDLLIQLHIEPHPVFRREGNNLILTVPVSLGEAVLGARI